MVRRRVAGSVLQLLQLSEKELLNNNNDKISVINYAVNKKAYFFTLQVAMGDRLGKLIEYLGLTYKAFAERIGVTDGAIRSVVKGRQDDMSGRSLLRIQREFQVNLGWLVDGEGAMFIAGSDNEKKHADNRLEGLPSSERKVVEDMISVLSKRSGPVVQSKPEAYSHSEVREIVELGSVAAGPLTSEEVTAGKKIQFPRALIPERGPLYALRVRGDSMIDANIHDGDYAIIRPVPQPQELKAGTIVVALVNGENTLKRLYRADHGATLRAANDRYPDIQVTKFQDLVIQGELRYLLKKIDGDGNGT